MISSPKKTLTSLWEDAAATARIASLLSVRRKSYDMRFGGDISWAIFGAAGDSIGGFQ